MSFKKSLSLSAIPLVFSLDRFFKILVLKNYSEGAGFAVLPGIFHITRVNNTGAAFGIMKHSGLLLALVSAVSVFFLALCMFRSRSRLAWMLVIAGALGNLYDRLRFGYVIDFLDFRVWPVFNIADASICIGVFLVLLGFFRKREIS